MSVVETARGGWRSGHSAQPSAGRGVSSKGVGGWGNFANAGAQADWEATFSAALSKVEDDNIRVMAMGVYMNIVQGQTKFVYYPQNTMNNTGQRGSTYATGTMDSRFNFSNALYGVSLNADRPYDSEPKTGTNLRNGTGYLPIGLLGPTGREQSTQPGISQALLLTSDNTYSFGTGCTTYNELAGSFNLEVATVANLAAIAGFRSEARTSYSWDGQSWAVDQSVKKVMFNFLSKNPKLDRSDRKALPTVIQP